MKFERADDQRRGPLYDAQHFRLDTLTALTPPFDGNDDDRIAVQRRSQSRGRNKKIFVVAIHGHKSVAGFVDRQRTLQVVSAIRVKFPVPVDDPLEHPGVEDVMNFVAFPGRLHAEVFENIARAQGGAGMLLKKFEQTFFE
jgi:hypothetical protein